MQTKFPTIQIISTMYGRRYAIITEPIKEHKFDDETVEKIHTIAQWGRTGMGIYPYTPEGLECARKKLKKLTE